jgi:hypothetical protein
MDNAILAVVPLFAAVMTVGANPSQEVSDFQRSLKVMSLFDSYE